MQSSNNSTVSEIPCRIVSGRGLASALRQKEIVDLAAVAAGEIVPGSLNLIASVPVYLDPKAAVLVRGIHMFFPARLGAVQVFVHRWRGAPAHVFEVFSSVYLRGHLGLEDNDTVSLVMASEAIDHHRTACIKHRLSWLLAWRFRERLFYASDWYASYVRSHWRARYAWRASQ
jgi:hypothetical protein